ncbi:MAG: hypothetical protein AABY40_04805 [Nanoarchaeota archaeon]
MKDLESLTIEQLKAGECPVERGLLLVSGLNESGVKAYQRKLDGLENGFVQWYEQLGEFELQDYYETAQQLFAYLYVGEKKLYGDDFTLAQVIDNRLDKDNDKAIGNCLGLTSLYSVLGARLGLDLAVLLSYNHILALLSCGQEKIVVENTIPEGFDIASLEEKEKHGFQKKDLVALVSAALLSRGFVKKKARDSIGAVQDYTKAIVLMPDHEPAYDLRGEALLELGDFDGALDDFNKFSLGVEVHKPWKKK